MLVVLVQLTIHKFLRRRKKNNIMKREIPWPEPPPEYQGYTGYVSMPSMTAHTYTKEDWEMLDALKRYDNKEITLIELKEIQEGKRK